ncbi:flagellar hook-associated protein FlgL [Caldanaerobius polysaccharolyticus]|uniref:flagellar hook-associated protein FlgL n=1 Tax=Caldanaerobius polysaccharolyticus TaxID=44256 RepID=UPI00047B1CDE|nr:flagellar hook-associated protein FlgL [Caldanaerobius polysaccharolyticus]
MRVTNNMMIDNMLRDLNNNLNRMMQTQKQMSSGVKFRVPSDDPIGVSRTVVLKSILDNNDQYIKNAKDGVSWLDLTDTALNQLTTDLQRVRELAVQGSNGTLSPEDAASIAQEIQQIKDDIKEIGNTTYAGRYIFGGYNTQNPPLTVQGGTITYRGINGGVTPQQIEFEVGQGVSIPVNVEAYQVFGIRDSASGKNDIFTDLDNLITALNKGDTQAVSSMLGKIDAHLNNVLAVRADIGARQNRMQLILDRLQDDNLNYTDLLSKTQDVDIAEISIKLANEQNVYTASLMLGSKIIMPTLIDFIK